MEDKKTVGFFEERAGVRSSQRLVFIAGQFCAMAMGWFVLYRSDGKDWAGALALLIGLSGTYGIQKLSQKRTEVKSEESKSEPENKS